ncbi:DUF4974 domain-containing protein [Spirosoma sp. HMF3257]|uniref:FecR family protein n=1 Tax=Spirosoma telluris TaxID=2183553 RepID=A0A327NHN6_9BACT|nr:DUF4974 domain-containing protein [Spirosoma telluris]RAI73444.1 FecR family protein [Spirosoma telluris]
MQPSLMKKIIVDYFDGNATSIQQKLIEDWLKEPNNKDLFFEYLDEWETNHPQHIFDIENGLKKVYENINNPPAELAQATTETKEIYFYSYIRWAAVASVLLFLSWIGWGQLTKPSAISYEHLVNVTKTQTGEIYEKGNFTTKPLLINLPDKSSIILQPNSKICYSPKQYNKTKREVILFGEAFFEVQKNPKKPFFVYTNDLITKVLGTSFSIRSQQSTPEIEVIVKTGRVSLFLQQDVDRNKKITGSSLGGFVLTANEKVKVSPDGFNINKPVMVRQESLTMPIQKLTFNFDETPIVDVLNDLESAYSIQIIYNHEKLASCKLTAHLSDEPLMEKLDLICSAMEATYEQVDNKIIIKSNGCK